MPEAQIAFPLTAYGQTRQGSRTLMFYNNSGADISPLRVVSFDGTGVTLATTGISGIATIGINNQSTLKAGFTGGIVVEGYLGADVVATLVAGQSMPSTGAIANLAVIKRSAATAGFVADATATPALGEPLGHAVIAAAGNLVNIYVCKRY